MCQWPPFLPEWKGGKCKKELVCSCVEAVVGVGVGCSSVPGWGSTEGRGRVPWKIKFFPSPDQATLKAQVRLAKRLSTGRSGGNNSGHPFSQHPKGERGWWHRVLLRSEVSQRRPFWCCG